MQDAIDGCSTSRFSKSPNGRHRSGCRSEPSPNTLRIVLVWASVALFAAACGGGGGGGGITASGSESGVIVDGVSKGGSGGGNEDNFGITSQSSYTENSNEKSPRSVSTPSLRLYASRYDPIAILTWSLSRNGNSASVVRYEYQVDSANSLDENDPWLVTNATRSSHVEDDLDDSLAYYFRVRAVLDDGQAVTSKVATAHPHPPSTRDPQPDKPVNLQARGGPGRVLLTWETPIPKKIVETPEGREAITAYLYKETNGIWRKTDSDHAQVIEGLQQNRSYTFWLKAVSNHGIGDVDSVSVTTTATLEMPAAPTGLAARKSGPWTDLQWDAPLWNGGAEITSYEYRVNTGNWTALAHRSHLVIDCPYRCTYSGSIQGASLGDSIQVRARNSVGPGTGSTAAEVFDTPGLSVFGATVHENHENAVTFRVQLDATTSNTVTVNYATRDGTAEAGTDYVAVSDTLTFAPGDRTEFVSVEIVQDSHDEDRETFTLVLSSPTNAHIVQAEATATIGNSDPMPRAWLARFGRTAAEHVLEAVAGRIAAPRVPGLEGSLADQQLRPGGGTGDEGTRRNHEELAAWVRKVDQRDGDGFGHGAYRPSGSELLAGSSFSFTSGSADGGSSSIWARGAYSDFDGRDGDLSLDGEVRTMMLGADYAREDWLAGLVISRSRGKGDYRGTGAGTVESRLTGLYPYAAREVSDRLSVWATAGYGEGNLTLTPEGQGPVETDMDLAMLAVGGRGQIVGREGYVLALKADGLLLRTTSDSVTGLASATANVNRLRLGLEGVWTVWLEDGSVLTPVLEVGLRHDGGDAETGFGADLGGGFVLENPVQGFSAELRARGLLTHEESRFEDWGISGSLNYDPDPASNLGLSVSVVPAWGAPSTGGMNRLWNLQGTTSLQQAGSSSQDGRINAEIGYGFAVAGGRFIGTPSLQFEQSEGGQHYRFGYRLVPPRGGGLDFGLEAFQHQLYEDGIEYRAGFTLATPW